MEWNIAQAVEFDCIWIDFVHQSGRSTVVDLDFSTVEAIVHYHIRLGYRIREITLETWDAVHAIMVYPMIKISP